MHTKKTESNFQQKFLVPAPRRRNACSQGLDLDLERCTCSVRIIETKESKPHDRLVPVSLTCYHTYTPGLLTL